MGIAHTLLRVATAAMLVAATIVPAADCPEGVDWTRRVVCAKGIGAVNPRHPAAAARPGALRAAQQTALRNALELVKGVPLRSNTTVAQSMAESDEVRSRVEGFVKGFAFSAPRYMDDLTVEVVARVPLDGLADLVLPADFAARPASPATHNGSGWTGLVVDARGLGLHPALAPRLIGEDSAEIYGPAQIDRSWAVRHGVAAYARTEEAARSLKERVGDNPAFVKALRANGEAKTDAVLAPDDAAALRRDPASRQILSEARVVFVVD